MAQAWCVMGKKVALLKRPETTEIETVKYGKNA